MTSDPNGFLHCYTVHDHVVSARASVLQNQQCGNVFPNPVVRISCCCWKSNEAVS